MDQNIDVEVKKVFLKCLSVLQTSGLVLIKNTYPKCEHILAIFRDVFRLHLFDYLNFGGSCHKKKNPKN